MLFFLGVEYMVSHHLEGREMAPAAPYGIEVVQANTGLADGQGIRWRRHLSRGHKRLKVGDGGDCQIDVVTQRATTGYLLMRVWPRDWKETEVVLAHLVQTMLALEYGRADKCVGIAGWIPAGRSCAVPGPEEFAAFLALSYGGIPHPRRSPIDIRPRRTCESAFAKRIPRIAKRLSKGQALFRPIGWIIEAYVKSRNECEWPPALGHAQSFGF